MASDTTGFGNALAKGISSYYQTRQQVDQQQLQRQRLEQDHAMKQQMYGLQMQKLQKEVQPIKFEIEKYALAKSAVEGGYLPPEELEKRARGIIDQADTPAQLRFIQMALQAQKRGEDPYNLDLNKTTVDVLQKDMGLTASANIRGQVMENQRTMKIEDINGQFARDAAKNKNTRDLERGKIYLAAKQKAFLTADALYNKALATNPGLGLESKSAKEGRLTQLKANRDALKAELEQASGGRGLDAKGGKPTSVNPATAGIEPKAPIFQIDKIHAAPVGARIKTPKGIVIKRSMNLEDPAAFELDEDQTE